MAQDRRSATAWDSAARAPAGHVVVVGNLKGGSGKSTLVINLAGALMEAGQRVAILDCDPQGTASTWARRGGAVLPVRHEPLRNLNGAGGWLVTAGELRREVDALLIDLPGVVAPAMGAAFLIASLILIPTAPMAVDVEGTRRVLAHLEKARSERPQSPPAALLVPVRVRELERGLVPWRQMLEPLGLPLTPPLRQHVAFDRAFEEGHWVGERFPESEQHREVRAIAARVLKELGLSVSPTATAAAARRRRTVSREFELAEAPAAPFAAEPPAPAVTTTTPEPAAPPPAPERRTGSWWRRVLGGGG